MSFNVKHSAFGLVAALPLIVSCGASLDDAAAGSATGGANEGNFSRQTDYQINFNIDFSGVSDASALSPTESLISWSDAMFTDEPVSAAGMRYIVFRGTTKQETLSDSGIIAITDPGVLSFTDSGLADNQTWYYSVAAMDPDDTISNNVQVAISRTPSEYAAGTMNFTVDVLPLFSSIRDPNDLTTNCLSCHTTPTAAGGMDLSTLEGIIAGIGTAGNPDSFIIPFLGDDSWSEFGARFTAGNILDSSSAFYNHLSFLAAPDGGTPLIPGDGIEDLQTPIRNWAFEGALPSPDSTPPVFEFADVQNAGLYYGVFTDFDSVRLFIPHASDPESIPVTGSLAGQIDYVVYAGTDSNSIDWDRPLLIKSITVNEANQAFVAINFDWTLSNELTVVVRPMDAAGRSVDIDIATYNPSDPNERELFRQRMRNMGSQEREILITPNN
jgi:hypothetical protein